MYSTYLTQRFTACIAILAVLLLFFAPIVSKNLAERHDRMMMTHDMSAMHTDMPTLRHHSAMPKSEHNVKMDEGFACGYCELLVHVPLMLWVFVASTWLMLIVSRAPPVYVVAQPLLKRVTGNHCPRAPPVVFNFTAF